ncbi:MAG: DUF222 domain-containing protein [Propionicimonas sp.]|uniref:HNH endonuclease signature motif containing protein n=1 Tax=Propionicimonas sp. TaxID=1955623 RepID=UPI003D09C462
MEMVDGPKVPAAVALAEVERLFDAIESDRSRLDAGGRLSLVKLARRVADRAEAFAGVVLAEADAAQASMRASGTPLSSWLGIDGRMSKREAAGALRRAIRLAENPSVAQAAADGRIGGGQARAIGGVLAGIAPQLAPEQRKQAADVLVQLADTLDADQLACSAGRVLAEVAPQDAAEQNETRLQRQAEAAQRQRSLRMWREGGSVRFDGSLPRCEGEAWMALLDAHTESQRRCALEERDPLAEPLTAEQRRADALIGMIQAHQVGGQAPRSGGDRPRIMVTLDYGALHDQAAGAGLIGDGEQISAGELRRLCCDAGLLPAVLGGPSQVLDIGRETRTVPAPIRAALVLRDGGCAFPTCHTRPAACEAHHIVPWWAGGGTALSNLVLLCHHHHALVEPARYGVRDVHRFRAAQPRRSLVRHSRSREVSRAQARRAQSRAWRRSTGGLR